MKKKVLTLYGTTAKKLIITVIISAFCYFFSFSPTVALNGTILGLVQQHIAYGLSKTTTTISPPMLSPQTITSQTSLQVSHVLQLQELAQQQLSESLMTQLEIAGNANARALILQQYLSTSSSLLQALQKAIDQEKTLMSSYQEKWQQCEGTLVTLNTDYQQAIKQYQGENAEKIVQQIIKERLCVAENSVYYKEHLLYRDLLQSSSSALQKRVTYLQDQENTILQYFDIMKPELLKKLYTVSQTLQTNF